MMPVSSLSSVVHWLLLGTLYEAPRGMGQHIQEESEGRQTKEGGWSGGVRLHYLACTHNATNNIRDMVARKIQALYSILFSFLKDSEFFGIFYCFFSFSTIPFIILFSSASAIANRKSPKPHHIQL